MKKYVIYPLIAVLGGAVAFYLRLQQNRTGFEADTGLPVSGNVFGIVLPIVLILLAVAVLALVFRLPRDRMSSPPSFTDAFFSAGALCPTLLVTGILAWLASGVYDLYGGMQLIGSRLELLQGGLSILAALSLIPVAAACRHGGKRIEGTAVKARGLNNNLLLVPVVCLVVRLVLAYREGSVNPALATYYVELLALAFLILGFYRVASFAFANGKTRRFVAYDMLAIIFCITTVADGHQIASTAMYCGCALLMLGFLLLRLEVLAQPPRKAATPIPDGDETEPSKELPSEE